MGLSHAVHWWQEWQLRVLVLGSLFVYLSLYFSYSVRRSPRMRMFRSLVWMAYVGGDALGIYALATLFNRQRQRSACGGGGSSDLEVLWAPVLLIHLGGQTTISAYSLEDNELWKRHAMTLVSQVTVALYVFCNWWSGERQLLNAAVLLFVVGIIKFSYKPWSLKRASFNNMLASAALLMERRKKKEGPIGRCWRWCTTYLMDIASQDDLDSMFLPPKSSPQELAAAGAEGELGVQHIEKDEEIHWKIVEVGRDMTPLGEFVRTARWHHGNAEKRKKIQYAFTPVSFLYKMFVNMPRSYSDRLKELKYLLQFSDHGSYKLLQECIYNTFLILYTRRRVTLTSLGIWLQLSLPFLTLASVVLFAKSHKGGYDVNDVWVTYVLFCFTALHEFFPFVPPFGMFQPKWHDMVSQGSLMSFCAWLGATDKLIRPYLLQEYVIKKWYVKQKPAANDITNRVRKHVKDGWNKYIYGPVSYRAFNNLRGQWALNKYRHKVIDSGHGSTSWSVLAKSLTEPFDESVLMWHVATDLCYNEDKHMFIKLTAEEAAAVEDGCSSANKKTLHSAYVSRKISNYMAYLLFIRPEMLAPGARSGLFNIASDHIATILEESNKNKGVPIPNRAQDIAQRIHDEDNVDAFLPQSTKSDNEFRHLLIDAKKMAEALMALGADDRWQMIDGVWVEMLCFSAARCSGYLHARSLGHGGEFLSYVWLLWSAMGMETLADKIIMTEPPGEEERRKEQEEEEEARAREERKESAARASTRPEVYVDHIIEEEIS